MKQIPTLEQRTKIYSKQSVDAMYTRGFSKGSALGLILLAAFIVLSGSLLHGQEGDDALFIDKNGSVTIGESLKVNEDIGVIGTVRAKKFEGDGSVITVGGVELVNQVKGTLPITLEEAVRAVIGDMVPMERSWPTAVTSQTRKLKRN